MVKLTLTHLLGGIISLLKRCYVILRAKLERITLLMFFDPYCDYLVKKSLKLNKSLGFNGEISGKRVTTDRCWDTLIHFEESTGCFLVSNISEATVALMFGTAYNLRRCIYLRSVVKRKLPFVIVEDGFIRSVMPFSTRLSGTQPDEKTDGLSYIVDHKGVYIDAKIMEAVPNKCQEAYYPFNYFLGTYAYGIMPHAAQKLINATNKMVVNTVDLFIHSRRNDILCYLPHPITIGTEYSSILKKDLNVEEI